MPQPEPDKPRPPLSGRMASLVEMVAEDVFPHVSDQTPRKRLCISLTILMEEVMGELKTLSARL
jgi:hypothetical protein